MYWSFRFKSASPDKALRVLPTLGMLLAAVNSPGFKTDLFLLHSDDHFSDRFIFAAPDGREFKATLKPIHGAIGIELPGDPSEWLDVMMKEAMRQIKGKGKRPFEMLSLEWNGFTAIGKMAFGVYRGLEPANGVMKHLDQLFLKNLGFGHNGPPHGNGHDENSRHDVHVAYALANNERIPDEVLKEYRELAASKGQIWQFDCKWAFKLLARPWLRGEFTANQLQVILLAIQHKDSPIEDITQGNLRGLQKIVASLRADFNHEEFLSALQVSGLTSEMV